MTLIVVLPPAVTFALAACDCHEALGTIATDDQLQAIVTAGGLTRFRRVAETAFNRVSEVKR